MLEKLCEGCGKSFEAKSPRRRFCDDVECKRERARSRKRVERGIAPVVALPAPEVATETVEAVTRAELEAADRLHTSAGLNALTLARRMDRADKDTGSSLASLSKQHLASLELALKDAPRPASKLDELRSRREARLASG